MINPRRVYTLILGGGAGSRLFPLTKNRAKPAVPFAGKYRLVDVPISNCLNSGLTHIFVLTQYSSHSLHRHIQQSYRLDFTSHGFVDILAAEQNLQSVAWYQGTADAVRQNLHHLADPLFSHVLILSGDQIYRTDFRDMFATHDRLQADLTIAVTPKRPEEAGGFGVLKADTQGRICDFVEKPTPEQMADLILPGEALAPYGINMTGPVVLVSMGIYTFVRDKLCLALANDMKDFGKHVIPKCIRDMRVFMHPFVGYWEDVGTMLNYFDANLAMTSWKPPFEFYSELSPIYTRPRFLPNNKLDAVEINQSIVSEGCFIRKAIINHSVIGVRSIIKRGSKFEHVIMLGQDTYGGADERSQQLPITEMSIDRLQPDLTSCGVGRNCHITRAILDKNICIGDEVTITDHTGLPDEDGDGYYVRDGIVIIPKNAMIAAGRTI